MLGIIENISRIFFLRNVYCFPKRLNQSTFPATENENLFPSAFMPVLVKIVLFDGRNRPLVYLDKETKHMKWMNESFFHQVMLENLIIFM